ncbi:MAG: chlorite dismutase family protein [Acidimicrobiales bacterium]
MAPPLLVSFRAGDVGSWRVESVRPVIGDPLAPASRLDVAEGSPAAVAEPPVAWTLRGFTSNERYVERAERAALTAVQAPLGRPTATRAALIPIRKSAAWWELTQDERRSVLETRSRHIAIGLRYLPAVARRLHHCRDLGEAFDFVTWFEYPPDAAGAFEDLVGELRRTEEWSYVEREVDIRLSR